MGSSQTIYDKQIILKNKNISKLEDIKRYDMIKSMKAPKSIILSKNKIGLLSGAILSDFGKYAVIQDHLREIHLSKNCIKEIPEEFLLLINLSILRLDHNQIETIPPKFSEHLYNLSELWLNNNLLTELPWNLNRLRQLRIIHLNHNQITYLPNTFGELILEELSLHHNPLSEELFLSNTVEGTLEAIIHQKIPKNYRNQVQNLIEEYEIENKGKAENELQFLFFLQQKEFRVPFRVYMEKEFSQENLDFWQRIDRFKWRYNANCEIRAPDLIKEALDIYKSYIVEGSPHSINVPSKVLEKLKSIFDDSFRFPNGINQWIFDEAYESVLKLMYSDTFSRYRLTKEGGEDFAKAVKMRDALPVNRLRKLGPQSSVK